MESYSPPVVLQDNVDPLTSPTQDSGAFTYGELPPEDTVPIRPVQESPPNLPASLPYDYPRLSDTHSAALICVTNPQFRDKAIGKYVIYTVKGTDSTGTFEAFRRYKDFEWLRKIIVAQWPGCYVPAIPGKQAIGNLNQTFIEMRRKLLEEFVVKCAGIEFIFNSDVFKTFIRGPDNFKASTQSYADGTVQNLPGRYIQYFPQFAEAEITSHMELDIENARKFVKEMSDFLENFSYRIKFVGAYYSSFIEGFSSLCKAVQDYDTKFLGDFRESRREGVDVQLKTTFMNPFDVLLDWVRAELLDHAGMQEALNSVIDLKNRLSNTSSKLASERLNLLKAQAGRKSFSQIIRKKTREDHMEHLEGGIKTLETQIHDLNNMIRIITARLALYEIPRFKAMKANTYDKIVKTYAGVSCEEFEYVRYM